jgi:hypothetical protein
MYILILGDKFLIYTENSELWKEKIYLAIKIKNNYVDTQIYWNR